MLTCNYREFEEEMGLGVRTSLGVPKFWPQARTRTLVRMEELTPRGWYFNASPEVFDQRYYEQLNAIGPTALHQKFGQIARTARAEKLVLLCFEKATTAEHCHRRMFAAWWLTETGEPVQEVGSPPDSYRRKASSGGDTLI